MATDATPRRRLHAAVLIVLGWALVCGPVVLVEGLAWSDPATGLMVSAMVLGCGFSLVYAVLGIPLMGSLLWLADRRGWSHRRRVVVALAPALLWAVFVFGEWALSPPLPRATFETVICKPMPASVRDLRAYRACCGPAGGSFILHFRVDPADFGAVLVSRPFTQLAHVDVATEPYFSPDQMRSLRGLEDCAAPCTFDGPEVYVHDANDDSGWRTYLITDREHRIVFYRTGR